MSAFVAGERQMANRFVLLSRREQMAVVAIATKRDTAFVGQRQDADRCETAQGGKIGGAIGIEPDHATTAPDALVYIACSAKQKAF
jgi:hypothetical protein